MGTRSAPRSSGTMPCGRSCWTRPTRQRDVEFTVERHWVSGSTVLAAWHASWIGQTDGIGRPSRRLPDGGRRRGRSDRPVPRGLDAGTGDDRVGERRIDGWRCVIRRRQRLRRAGTAQRARPGPARGRHALRLQGRDRRPRAGEERAHPAHRRRVSRRRRSRTSSNRRRSGATCRSRSSTGARSRRPAATRSARRIGLRRGLPEEVAKQITKLIRDEFPKVKSQIQGDAVRVSGKSKDDLQRIMAKLRELDETVPLQFENYR